MYRFSRCDLNVLYRFDECGAWVWDVNTFCKSVRLGCDSGPQPTSLTGQVQGQGAAYAEDGPSYDIAALK